MFGRLKLRNRTQPTRDETADADARRRQIEALMAGPVRARPAITVVGDEEVFGVSPIRSDA